jgi:alkane 1-monooxygenase
MPIRVYKYLLPLSLYILVFFSFYFNGIFSWLPIIYAFVIVPSLEFLIKPNEANMEKAEEEITKNDKRYDYMLYAFVVLIFPSLAYFLYIMYNSASLTWYDVAGKILSMGLLVGTMGINIGHELGHRVKPLERFLAKAALLSSLYMHFYIEHNKGHHKNVATPLDPASSRYNEPLYTFFIRSIWGSYFSAWHIANADCSKAGKPAFSWHNEMLRFHVIQIAFVTVIFFITNWFTAFAFVASAIFGFLLLETVNYIEHYGLARTHTSDGKYERTMPQHSWNSNHAIGRLLLFELSRHSDHHYLASRKYQVLRHHEIAPQMPTGYPGMMVLSTIPPLWFKVMNKRVNAIQQANIN